MSAATYQFNFIVWQEGEVWVAQALEVDLSFQAENRKDLCYEVQRGLAAQVSLAVEDGDEPFDLDPPPEGVEGKAEEGPFLMKFKVWGNTIEFDNEVLWRVV